MQGNGCGFEGSREKLAGVSWGRNYDPCWGTAGAGAESWRGVGDILGIDGFYKLVF